MLDLSYTLDVMVLAAAILLQLFPFQVDQDSLAGAPDFSDLNRPLTAADKLFARDGHFYRVGLDLTPNTTDDERVRLFGVNFAFDANFPLAPDAVRVAKRLRKLGINLVRLHHMDSQPDAVAANARSLLTAGPYPTLNPNSLPLLRGFLDALRAEGIYVNLNLHVGYTFRPAVDGVPAIPPGQQFPAQSKPLHIFQPRMVELQTRFTRMVIEALNLRSDPVLGMVEIDNETSLVREWQTTNLEGALHPEYKRELEQQWNTWLRGRYGSTERVAAAWRAEEEEGPELLQNGDFSQGMAPWRMEIQPPSQASLRVVQDAGAPAALVEVTATGNFVFLKQVNFSIVRGAPYEAAFEARAALPDGQTRAVTFDVKEDVSPWRQVTSRTVTLTNRWQRFTVGFEPNLAMDGIGRFALQMNSVTGQVLVRNCSLRQVARRGLAEGESLEQANIALVGEREAASAARTNDYLTFLAEADRRYLLAMRDAVRESIAWPAPIAGTQMGYGGVLNLDSHESLDYQDNHFYVDHYNFPNVQWDGRDWRIRNLSAVGSGLASLQAMAAAREAGRPYTVSEYNQPWPNTQAAEILPVMAAFGAFQDWDGLMYFAYEHGRTWDTNVGHGFNLNGEPHKLAQVGQAAWLFRSGAVRAGRSSVAVPLSREIRLRAGREKRNGAIPAFLQTVFGYDPNTAFVHPVSIYRSEADSPPALVAAKPAPPFVADTGELTYDPVGRIYRIHAEWAAGLIGYLGREHQTAGPLGVQLAASSRGFAAVVVTPLDGQPLARSRKLLLTAPGYTLRSRPNGTEPQLLVNYPNTTDWLTLEPEPGMTRPSGNLNGGASPNWMERLEGEVTLDLPGARIAVFPLDGNGGRREALSAEENRFQLQPSPWYEIVVSPAGPPRRR